MFFGNQNGAGQFHHSAYTADKQYDCRVFNAMAKVMRDCELVFHSAATAYEGLSVFSWAMVMDNIVSGSNTPSQCLIISLGRGRI